MAQLARIEPQTTSPAFSRDQVALIKSSIAKGATDDELKMTMIPRDIS